MGKRARWTASNAASASRSVLSTSRSGRNWQRRQRRWVIFQPRVKNINRNMSSRRLESSRGRQKKPGILIKIPGFFLKDVRSSDMLLRFFHRSFMREDHQDQNKQQISGQPRDIDILRKQSEQGRHQAGPDISARHLHANDRL